MKIREVTIENFGSIKKQHMGNLGDYQVLVGQNGAGKTHVLEALNLFFSEFSLTGGVTQLSGDLFWFERDPTSPISISLTLELSEAERKRLFRESEGGSELKDAGNFLTITRSLHFPAQWRTDRMCLGSIRLITEDKLLDGMMGPESEPNSLAEIPRFVLYLFGPAADMLTGLRILVDEEKKVAFLPDLDPAIEHLAKSGQLRVSTEFASEKIEDWPTSRGLTVYPRPPEASEAPELFAAINGAKPKSASLVGLVGVRDFAEALRSCFVYVPSIRDNLQLGPRATSLPAEVLGQINRISQSNVPKEQKAWRQFKDDVDKFIEKEAEPHSSGLELWSRGLGLRLPPGQLGGGEQAQLHLRSFFLEPCQIYAIDEPELHFHPSLCRTNFAWLKEQSSRHQVIVASHSPLFVDKVDISNNWMVKFNSGETTFSRIEDRQDFAYVLAGLGILPSDIFMQDVTLFLEGQSDVEFLKRTLNKAGLNPSTNSVALVSLGGGDNPSLTKAISLWVDLMGQCRGRYLVRLDSNRASTLQQLVSQKGWDPKLFQTWKAGELEDLYPPELLAQVIKQLSDVDIPLEDFKKRKGQTCKLLEERLPPQTLNKLKMPTAIILGDRIEAGEVHAEIKDLASGLKKLLP